MYILSWSDLGASILESFKVFMYSVCSIIYKLIIYLYDFFDMLCHGRIMDNNLMEQISVRVGLILGLIMFFRVAFVFIQYLLNPDVINDKEKGAFNVIKKILIVIVLLGTYSYIFDFVFKVQNVLLGDNNDNVNVISRLLLPEVVDTENFGGAFSANLFMSFYTMNDGLIPLEFRGDTNYERCYNYRLALQNEIINDNEFQLGYNCLTSADVIDVSNEHASDPVTVEIINFNYLLAIVVGVFVCWSLLVYCFSVGIRIIQLAFLEIIAPMPIISYISPQKDGMFQKWFRMCTTTYLDIFIRVAIINFIVLIIANIINGFATGTGIFFESLLAYKGSSFVSDSIAFIMVIMILALLQFAKKAPELIKELLPKSMTASGDFGFGLKNRDVLGKAFAVAGGVVTGSAVGLISGVAGGRGISKLTGAVGGILGGAARGINTGVHSKGAGLGDITKSIGDVRKKQADVGMKRAQRIYSGGTFTGEFMDSVRSGLGVMNPYQLLEGEYASYKDIKADIDDDDEVKMQTFAEQEAYSKYRQQVTDFNSNLQPGQSAKTLLDVENWRKTAGLGKDYADAIEAARTKFIQSKYGKDAAFTAKIDMHNRRFGTKYDSSTDWSTFNTARKAVKGRFEEMSARKPRK